MNKHWVAGAAAAAMVSLAGAADAQLLFQSAAGDFNNSVGAALPVFVDADMLPGEEIFRYGDTSPLPGLTQSSLTFSSAAMAAINPGAVFTLGTLEYRNGANTGNETFITVGFDVASNLLFNGAPLGGLASYQFTIENTTNSGVCPYPSVTPCSDRVSIQALSGFQTFNVGGQELRLFVDGFRDTNGVIQQNFIGQEDTTTIATLVGRVDLISNTTPAPVPEPGSWLLMIAGFGGLGAALRAGRSRRSVEALA
jgi:hypothetical protein